MGLFGDGQGDMLTNKFGKTGTYPSQNPDVMKGMGSLFSKDSAGGWIGLGANLSTGISQAFPEQYDQRIGIQKPSFLKEMLDATYTGMGASIGGPWGALVGGIIDTGKNIGSYVNKLAKYRQGVTKYQNTEAQEQRMQGMLPDYTTYSRYGTQAKYNQGGMVPVEIERNEAVVMPNGGGYELMGVTPQNAPTHEQGGIKMMLPQGALVFPSPYVKPVVNAIQTGNNGAMDALKGDMLSKAQQAAMNGEPYSSGGLFGNGGEVAEEIMTITPDSDKRSIRQLSNSIIMSNKLDQDEKDILLMGLMSRVNHKDEFVQEQFAKKHPEYYAFFTGDNSAAIKDIEYLQGINKGIKEGTIKMDADEMKGHISNIDERLSKYGKIDEAIKNKDFNAFGNVPMGTTDVLDWENPFGYNTNPGTMQATNMYQFMQKRVGLMDEDRPQDYTDPKRPEYKGGKTGQGTGAKPSTSVEMDARTATRQAAMKAGVYQDKDGTPLTYWDSKTGKRLFTQAASKYGYKSGDDISTFLTGGGKQSEQQGGQNLMRWDYKTGKPMEGGKTTTVKESKGGVPTSPYAGGKGGDAPIVEQPVVEQPTNTAKETNTQQGSGVVPWYMNQELGSGMKDMSMVYGKYPTTSFGKGMANATPDAEWERLSREKGMDIVPPYKNVYSALKGEALSKARLNSESPQRWYDNPDTYDINKMYGKYPPSSVSTQTQKIQSEQGSKEIAQPKPTPSLFENKAKEQSPTTKERTKEEIQQSLEQKHKQFSSMPRETQVSEMLRMAKQQIEGKKSSWTVIHSLAKPILDVAKRNGLEKELFNSYPELKEHYDYMFNNKDMRYGGYTSPYSKKGK